MQGLAEPLEKMTDKLSVAWGTVRCADLHLSHRSFLLINLAYRPPLALG